MTACGRTMIEAKIVYDTEEKVKQFCLAHTYQI